MKGYNYYTSSPLWTGPPPTSSADVEGRITTKNECRSTTNTHHRIITTWRAMTTLLPALLDDDVESTTIIPSLNNSSAADALFKSRQRCGCHYKAHDRHCADDVNDEDAHLLHHRHTPHHHWLLHNIQHDFSSTDSIITLTPPCTEVPSPREQRFWHNCDVLTQLLLTHACVSAQTRSRY